MIGKLHMVVIDAPDIGVLSDFYTGLAGWTPSDVEPDWITLTTDDGWRIGLQQAPDHQPPQWPDQARPQQAHLDIRVPDLAAATAQAIGLGATLVRENETWHTLIDPAGHPFDLCLNPNDPRTTLMGVMLDCPDAKELSGFYAQLLGKPITYEGDGVAMIGNDGEHPVLFQQVTDYTPPKWPDPARPQQFHLDVAVEDLDAADEAAQAIGATRLPGANDTFLVYADPANKPFCLVLAG
jgi:predicted enzyme related to lactoylglutathione lyase